MPFQFAGKQNCSYCGNNYEWVTTLLESGESLFGELSKININVKECSRINQTSNYCIKIACPKCGKQEFVEQSRE